LRNQLDFRNRISGLSLGAFHGFPTETGPERAARGRLRS
jgi:hypothetical protein